jgi:hypothetical protein
MQADGHRPTAFFVKSRKLSFDVFELCVGELRLRMSRMAISLSGRTMLFLQFVTGFVFFQLRRRSAVCIVGGLGMWRDRQLVGRWLLFMFGEVWIDFEHLSVMVLRPMALKGASLQDQAFRPDGRTCLRVSLGLIGLIIVLIGLDGQN